MPLTKYSNSIFFHDEKIRKIYPVITGIDEAGRGPLAGPVVAATVILQQGLIIGGLKDSKQVTETRRKKLFWDIVYSAEDIGIGIVEADVIDRINILESTKLAMEIAIKDLSKVPDILLIDTVSLLNYTHIAQKSIIKGESVSASIAAASIVAKTVRDDIMYTYHKEYPLYNFGKNKGYSTKEHMEYISLYGPCQIHRKSFKKVMDIQLPLKVCEKSRE